METNFNKLFKDDDEIYFFGEYITYNQEVEELKPTYTVDQLLDQYNDNISLYKQFGDDEYLITANEIMLQLKTKQYTN